MRIKPDNPWPRTMSLEQKVLKVFQSCLSMEQYQVALRYARLAEQRAKRLGNNLSELKISWIIFNASFRRY